MKDVLYRLELWWNMLINSVFYLNYSNPLILNAWTKIRKGKIENSNWGDDINYYLLRLISGKNIIVRNKSLFHRIHSSTNYICIGSILGWYENKNAVIWGAGFLEGGMKLRSKPKSIKLVRGKLTREELLKQGYDCPQNYGDPALLISRFYKPNIEMKYRLGIVAHFVDSDNSIIKSFLEMHNDCIFIDLVHYKKWTDVVDLILSCEKVISSSLHGLIVADSYSKPNMWVTFSDKIAGGFFKYYDYFSSIGREGRYPKDIRNEKILEELYMNDFKTNDLTIDFEGILKSCPFYNYNHK